MCSEFQRGPTETCMYDQRVFLKALFCAGVWGQPGWAVLKPCESHANNAALCLLLLDWLWHLQRASLTVVTFTWSWAAERRGHAGAGLMQRPPLTLGCRCDGPAEGAPFRLPDLRGSYATCPAEQQVSQPGAHLQALEMEEKEKREDEASTK